ncbi:MAG: response regulator transcription factor [Sulfuricella sp.]|nr:response regulator transcription factor [Sulfuricella sp.]
MNLPPERQPAQVRILIVDDHPIVREGMASFLGVQANLHLCCEASNAEEALAAMENCRHDLAIVDISLDGGSGLELIKVLRRKYPQLAILTLSMYDETAFAERALQAGANGYLMKQKGTKNILAAVQQILAGNIYLSEAMLDTLAQRQASPHRGGVAPLAGLSEREFEVLHLIGQGLGTRQIAERLNRSVKTIEAHQARIKGKLQLDSGRDLVRFALQLTEGL